MSDKILTAEDARRCVMRAFLDDTDALYKSHEALRKEAERLALIVSGQEAALNRMCIALTGVDAWKPNANLEKSVLHIVKDRDRYKSIIDWLRDNEIAVDARAIKFTEIEND